MGHVVWTLEDVVAAIPDQPVYWISHCICREEAGGRCSKGLRTCLGFHPGYTSTEHGRREVTRDEVDALVAFARRERLIPRPFLSDDGDVVASCFCCDCCCTYVQRAEGNVPGPRIEETDRAACTDCGDCVEHCSFGARSLTRDGLALDRARCMGCGLCVEDCPVGAIRMVARA